MLDPLNGSQDSMAARYALEYAGIGFRVVPLWPETKIPTLDRWPSRASADPETIRAWFRAWPDANVGIIMGRGTIAFDIDRRSGGWRSWEGLLRGAKLAIDPQASWKRSRFKRTITAGAITGTGGGHYLFRVDPTVEYASLQGIRQGLDIVGEGGMLAVEPSRRKDGGEYLWLRRPQQGIAPLPAALRSFLKRKAGPKLPAGPRSPSRPLGNRTVVEENLLRQLIDRFPISAYGQRHREMCRAIGSLLGRDYATNVLPDTLEAWHEHFERLDVVRTGWVEARREAEACVKSTLANPSFLMKWTPSTGPLGMLN